MKDKQLEKLTEWGWISIHNKFYSFNPKGRQAYGIKIYELLDELLDTEKSIAEYESLESFTLVKKISFMKAISLLNAREFIIRDSKQLLVLSMGSVLVGIMVVYLITKTGKPTLQCSSHDMNRLCN
ncbi:hypothetical protein V6N13_040059 [Hibiscus sabdariffa]|uniref:Uncharacterized protein n=1 Tax=Hibiscus sabdariffa TaxID=183260 RepID=A0ABR1ZID0_9ROSI